MASSLSVNSEQRGSVFLLANALSTVVLTYVAAYGSLNLQRALWQYDTVVPSIRAPSKSSNVPVVLFFVAIISLQCGLVYWMVTDEGLAARVVPKAAELFGYLTYLPGLYFFVELRPGALETYRSPLERYAAPVISRVNEKKSQQLLLTLLVVAAAIYTGPQHTAWWFIVSAIGLSTRLARGPHAATETISVRGLFSASLAMPLAWIIILAIPEPGNQKTLLNQLSDESTVLFSWQALPLQLYSGLIGMLAAAILRYEWSISIPTYPRVLQDTESSSSSTPKPRSMSAKEASLIRAPIPQGRLQFSAPLFHTMLLFSFLAHVPSIILNGPFAEHFMLPMKNGSQESLALVVEVLRSFPGQIWALVLVPTVLVIASAVRTDRRRLWGYSETWAKKLVDTDADVSVSSETK